MSSDFRSAIRISLNVQESDDHARTLKHWGAFNYAGLSIQDNDVMNVSDSAQMRYSCLGGIQVSKSTPVASATLLI